MQVGTIGVIGAGVMGNGIAQIAAAKGIDVILLDVNEEAVKKGIDAVEGRLGRVVAKGQMSPAEKEAAVRRIRPTTAYESLKPADVIIEAATEDYGLKTRIFKQVDALVSADSIVASNTSSVSITKLAASMSRPEHGAILVDFMFRRGRRTAASDCKAYSLAKYAGAQELGISADRVRLVVVHNSRHAEDHKVGRRLEDVSFAVGQPKPPVGCNYG
jgi:3-hydroxyacyl-CoA dehydrogenase, NAD binding domain